MGPEKRHREGYQGLIHSKIECTSCREEGIFPAIIYNISGENVCLLTDHEVNPEEVITIHTSREISEEASHGIRINDRSAVVKWSRPIVRKDRRLYLAVLNLPQPGTEEEPVKDACEICATSTGEEDACHGQGFSWLCPECNELISRLPEKLEEITDKFLVGNPL